MQGVWWDDSSLLMLPHMDRLVVQALAAKKLEALPQLLMEARHQPQRCQQLLQQALGNPKHAQECLQASQRHTGIPSILGSLPWSLLPMGASSLQSSVKPVHAQQLLQQLRWQHQACRQI